MPDLPPRSSTNPALATINFLARACVHDWRGVAQFHKCIMCGAFVVDFRMLPAFCSQISPMLHRSALTSPGAVRGAARHCISRVAHRDVRALPRPSSGVRGGPLSAAAPVAMPEGDTPSGAPAEPIIDPAERRKFVMEEARSFLEQDLVKIFESGVSRVLSSAVRAR